MSKSPPLTYLIAVAAAVVLLIPSILFLAVAARGNQQKLKTEKLSVTAVQWEPLQPPTMIRRMWRTPIHNGWLVIVDDSSAGGVLFVMDPSHAWLVEDVEDVEEEQGG